MIHYIYIALTILLTCYGQLILKWRIHLHGAMPVGVGARVIHLLSLFLDIYILSGFLAAFLASLCWMSAISKLPLSHAYPFMGSTFAIVLLGSSLFFDEPLTWSKLLGTILIMVGIALGSMG